MKFTKDIVFKNLKPLIAEGIKESCYRSDVRLYNVAKAVLSIETFSYEPGIEIIHGLALVIDKTFKEAVELGCDLSIIVNGILLGTFRSSFSLKQDEEKIISAVVKEIMKALIKYNGDVKQTVEGIFGALIATSKELKFDLRKACVIAKEDVLTFTIGTTEVFTKAVNEALPNIN